VNRGFLSWVRSNDKEIIDVLEEQAANLVKATSYLVEFMSSYKMDGESRYKIIKDLERQGDQITHKLFTILDKTFVTPLDPEDISKLTSAIDEVLDATEGVANRFVLFTIQAPTTYMIELSKILLSASQEVQLLITRIRNLKSASDLIDHSKNIVNYEHKADTIYRTAIAELFKTNNNPIEIIKLKEIYETLEGALDRCADVADVVEDIALKYGNG
jgi:predicted phosphate transport protein (TIGR00153 family)